MNYGYTSITRFAYKCTWHQSILGQRSMIYFVSSDLRSCVLDIWVKTGRELGGELDSHRPRPDLPGKVRESFSTKRYRGTNRAADKLVAEAKGQALEEFGETMEKDFLAKHSVPEQGILLCDGRSLLNISSFILLIIASYICTLH